MGAKPFGPISGPDLVLVLALVAGAAPAQDAPSAGAIDTALEYVEKNAADLGVKRADVADLVVTSAYRSRHNGVTHVNLNQRYRDLEVFGGHATVNVAEGTVVFAGRQLRGRPRRRDVRRREDRRGRGRRGAADALELPEPTDLRILEPEWRPGGRPSSRAAVSPTSRSRRASAGSRPRTACASPGSSRSTTRPTSISGTRRSTLRAGSCWRSDDWTSHDDLDELRSTLQRDEGAAASALGPLPPDQVLDGSSYRVFDIPKESPNDAPRGLVTNPADGQASPFSWHDTDAAPGAEFTITRGNNVHAYLDQDNDNSPDFGDTDGGTGLAFDFPADLTQHAQNYRDAVVTNLFYTNNIFHDVMWRYGFDEASGNFQANNYGRGGTSGDYVRAEAADGGGTNNANFSTPVETSTSGGTPRMQMYLWPGNQFGPQNQVVVDGLGSFDASWSRFGPAPTTAGTSGTFVYAGTGCDAGLYPPSLPAPAGSPSSTVAPPPARTCFASRSLNPWARAAWSSLTTPRRPRRS